MVVRSRISREISKATKNSLLPHSLHLSRMYSLVIIIVWNNTIVTNSWIPLTKLTIWARRSVLTSTHDESRFELISLPSNQFLSRVATINIRTAVRWINQLSYSLLEKIYSSIAAVAAIFQKLINEIYEKHLNSKMN